MISSILYRMNRLTGPLPYYVLRCGLFLNLEAMHEAMLVGQWTPGTCLPLSLQSMPLWSVSVGTVDPTCGPQGYIVNISMTERCHQLSVLTVNSRNGRKPRLACLSVKSQSTEAVISTASKAGHWPLCPRHLLPNHSELMGARCPQTVSRGTFSLSQFLLTLSALNNAPEFARAHGQLT